jgi:hypothetical protein
MYFLGNNNQTGEGDEKDGLERGDVRWRDGDKVLIFFKIQLGTFQLWPISRMHQNFSKVMSHHILCVIKHKVKSQKNAIIYLGKIS